MDYTKYTAEKLLEDDYFIHSMRYPTQQSKEFWESLIRDRILSQKEFDFARKYMIAVSVEKECMPETDLHLLHERIKSDTILQAQKKKKRYYLYSLVASCLLISVSISLYFYASTDADEIVGIAKSMQKTENMSHIELVLSNKERISIEEDSVLIDYVNNDSVLINERTVEKDAKIADESTALAYNQLIVPYGKSSRLILEDGTHIWVNAGTQVVYPVNFKDDKREIYVNGEIYLEVAHDRKRPFHVKTSGMEVLVLGTSFNFMAYENDSTRSVVLVKGSVQVKDTKNRKPYILEPEQMFLSKNNQIDIKKVNVETYTSWKDGMFVYDKESLQTVAQRLSRYYNATITVDKRAAGLLFTGKLDLKNDLSKVLEVIGETGPVDCIRVKQNEYHLIQNTLK